MYEIKYETRITRITRKSLFYAFILIYSMNNDADYSAPKFFLENINLPFEFKINLKA